MANWSLIGSEKHEKFAECLDAEVLADELNYYRVELGETFGLRDLLEQGSTHMEAGVRGIGMLHGLFGHLYQALGCHDNISFAKL